MSDLVTFGETMLRLSPPQGDRVETARELEFRAAGAESNVAVTAERLGAVATWLSKLPDSPLGRRVVSGLRQHGINVDVAWSDQGRQGTYYLEYGGKPRGTNVIYDRKGAAVQTTRPEELNLDAVRTARVFYTSGITPALSNRLRETTAQLLKTAKESGTKTAFDVNYRSSLWSEEEARETLTRLFPAVDILVVPFRDAQQVLNFERDPRQLAHHLAAEYNLQTVIVTNGEKGSLAWHSNTVYEQDIYEADTHDAIGTGDAFVGAFLARRLSGDDVPRALKYAAATASLKRTIAGDIATVTKQEVEAVIGDDMQDISR
ncbi:bifunctional 2-dehydro-3-deoxygluconokinase/2-dehydro-3-deoxygalactonokinase [Natranaeroarchaeum sulfidigenes]|uniref:Sugar kinase, ribokinase family n=1 Tax=Natranaeroarchaeum sulfidigenes TaxID=2784880 RepID=A0A897MMD0_9EURY|nr:bifunctional 2-dehydro-3-deoxygluconokinase/2-dehydro-3-deoxygalactonokinase [Natranaeroarchaeum sulfidigenes]QSG03350.1 Sugar kinase, ribokinase family [Natranaeroarchaeum sulfidigenes]